MFLKFRLWCTERRLTRLYHEIERHRRLQGEAKNDMDVFREVRNMVFQLTKQFEDATVQKSIIQDRIRSARVRKEIKGRLKK